MGRYAAKTGVPAERSKAEIEKVLERYGADQFVRGHDEELDQAVLGFRLQRRLVRINLPLPPKPPEGCTRAVENAWAQDVRQRWRALLLVVKAKLEAVESGIVSFDEEWLAYIVMGKGTVGQQLIPQVEESYEKGKTPSRLQLTCS